ncbi:uncharacterized protein LOC143301041 [Babylonia areolata]|uniref:uncharacterized protein LOC143301041 n=1 Tax=Babylonia areolata TaxID=304850 RepID=UPI003FD22DED
MVCHLLAQCHPMLLMMLVVRGAGSEQQQQQHHENEFCHAALLTVDEGGTSRTAAIGGAVAGVIVLVVIVVVIVVIVIRQKGWIKRNSQAKGTGNKVFALKEGGAAIILTDSKDNDYTEIRNSAFLPSAAADGYTDIDDIAPRHDVTTPRDDVSPYEFNDEGTPPSKPHTSSDVNSQIPSVKVQEAKVAEEDYSHINNKYQKSASRKDVISIEDDYSHIDSPRNLHYFCVEPAKTKTAGKGRSLAKSSHDDKRDPTQKGLSTSPQEDVGQNQVLMVEPKTEAATDSTYSRLGTIFSLPQDDGGDDCSPETLPCNPSRTQKYVIFDESVKDSDSDSDRGNMRSNAVFSPGVDSTSQYFLQLPVLEDGDAYYTLKDTDRNRTTTAVSTSGGDSASQYSLQLPVWEDRDEYNTLNFDQAGSELAADGTRGAIRKHYDHVKA